MANYYFLGTLLPDLYIDQPPEIGVVEFMHLLKDNLSKDDYAKAVTVLNYNDLVNLLSYLKDEHFELHGNLNENDFEEALATRSGLPSYVYQYLDSYHTKEERLNHFPQLLSIFFKEEIQNSTGSFRDFLILERDLRLILVAYRAKKLGRDLLRELQFEDPEDQLIAQIIAQKDSSQYIFPDKYEDLKQILERFSDDPIGLQKALYEYRFNKIDQKIGIDFFSIDRIIAYMLKLFMIENWQRLDKQKGLEIVDSMLKEPL